MKKVFWDDPYQRELNTTILNIINNNQILFAETIAFSFSGGQESDSEILTEYNSIISKNLQIIKNFSDIKNQ